MRLYIAGPMTDLPDDNSVAFEYAAKRLFNAGHVPVSPPELDQNQNIETDLSMSDKYKLVLPRDIVDLSKCDGLILLPGWEESRGTGLELHACDLFELPKFAPDHTSGEFPGGLAEWMDVVIEMIDVYEFRTFCKEVE